MSGLAAHTLGKGRNGTSLSRWVSGKEDFLFGMVPILNLIVAF